MKTRPLLTAALTAVLLLTAPLNTIASGRTDSPDFRFRGYIGGMMLHSGYIQSRPFELYSTASQSLGTMQIRGAAFGIGGHVKFAFGTPTDMLRIGAEGHSSNVRYAGGGGVKNHIIAQGGTGDFVIEPQAAMHKYAFMAIAPFLGIEVALTPKLSLVLKADWLLNATGCQNDFTNGPRLYVGMLFNRLQR